MSSEKQSIKKYIPANLKCVYTALTVLAGILLLIVFSFHSDKGQDYEAFLNVLGARESSDNYHAVNRYGYLGRYQMGEMALQDAGFQDSQGSWTELAKDYGISSESDFLNCPEGQDAAVKAYHMKLCRYIKSYGMDRYIGETYAGVPITPSGLLAACHLVGVKSMREALKNGETVCDANHVPASEYMELFSGFDISTVWGQSADT